MLSTSVVMDRQSLISQTDLGNPSQYDAFAINMAKTDNAGLYSS